MLLLGSRACTCPHSHHDTRLVALTGGPGAGKTAILEMARRTFCNHIAVLPEAASVVFGGGFPRHATLEGRKAGQRAIYHVQRECEMLVLGEGEVAVALCDRGTVDGVAYWPGDPSGLFAEVRSSLESEIPRYAAVIHLETPGEHQGYNNGNPLRIESALEAREIDRRIADAWSGHPRRFMVPSTNDFMEKASSALALLRAEIPTCCLPTD